MFLTGVFRGTSGKGAKNGLPESGRRHLHCAPSPIEQPGGGPGAPESGSSAIGKHGGGSDSCPATGQIGPRPKGSRQGRGSVFRETGP
ncbi:hypothetical protein Y981_06120 [Leptospirillum ferriphilum YSK]|uniref:Uncharacterized protein n=1 Tax=Leptospirillum ferriphilum YSK TaxID=1441628 RepID=A0A059XUG9_9BACT|nr:hypothetical protein Y981_06120 [Leptospirillum ferriphilum YSK]